jgi:hypothetical protein
VTANEACLGRVPRQREQNGSPPAATVLPHQFLGIDLTGVLSGGSYNFGELTNGVLTNGFASAAVPPVVPPVGPDPDPTFISKVLLTGGNVTGNLNGDVAYVRGLYHQLLGRVPDVDGLNFWMFQLDAGASRTQVADAFWRSPEHRGMQVDQFYQNFLHRASDPAGRAFWVNAFLGGAGEADVAEGILSSAEYLAGHQGAAAFIGGLYQDALGRAADAAGSAYWQAALQNGASPASVAEGILLSAESSQQLLNRLYGQFLGRTPDALGQQPFLPLLETSGTGATTVADLLLGSDEFFASLH